MTLVEHLSELRLPHLHRLARDRHRHDRRLVPRAARDHICSRRRSASPLVFTTLGGAFFLQLKLALMIGVALASPIVLYQLWAFVSPGLTPRERRVARPWVPLALVFLVLGVGVAYVILPLHGRLPARLPIPGVIEPLITVECLLRVRDDHVPGLRPGDAVSDRAGAAGKGRHGAASSACAVAAVTCSWASSSLPSLSRPAATPFSPIDHGGSSCIRCTS